MMAVSSARAEVRLHDDEAQATPPPNAEITPPPSLGEWHHYAFAYTGAQIRLYIDGIMSISTAPAARTQHGLDVVSIGGFTDTTAVGWQDRLLHGRIDEVRWRSGADDDAPNDVWVAALYESHLTPGDTFTQAPVENF